MSLRHSAAFRVAPSLQSIRAMGAWAKDVEVTCETANVRPERGAKRRGEGRILLFELPTAEPDTDFDDELTDPDPLPDILPTWAPADIGQALIDEWDASAEARAARPALVARVLAASVEETAITSVEKPAIRSAC